MEFILELENAIKVLEVSRGWIKKKWLKFYDFFDWLLESKVSFLEANKQKLMSHIHFFGIQLFCFIIIVSLFFTKIFGLSFIKKDLLAGEL